MSESEMQTTTVSAAFGEFLDQAWKVWQRGGPPNEVAGEIRRLALVALSQRDDEADKSPASDGLPGPAVGIDPHTQMESDARHLTGRSARRSGGRDVLEGRVHGAFPTHENLVDDAERLLSDHRPGVWR